MINDTDTESNIAEQERRNIEDLGSVETKNPRGNIHCLNIIGQVEGHMAKKLEEALRRLRKIRKLTDLWCF